MYTCTHVHVHTQSYAQIPLVQNQFFTFLFDDLYGWHSLAYWQHCQKKNLADFFFSRLFLFLKFIKSFVREEKKMRKKAKLWDFLTILKYLFIFLWRTSEYLYIYLSDICLASGNRLVYLKLTWYCKFFIHFFCTACFDAASSCILWGAYVSIFKHQTLIYDLYIFFLLWVYWWNGSLAVIGVRFEIEKKREKKEIVDSVEECTAHVYANANANAYAYWVLVSYGSHNTYLPSYKWE